MKGNKALKRIRARFTKGEEVKFISHLDLMRAILRACRRAGVPLALTEGFHPHPKVSFGPALAVGMTSDAEYADFELENDMDAGDFAAAMNAVLPAGIRILQASCIPSNWKALSAVLGAASYIVKVERDALTGSPDEGYRLGEFLRQGSIVVQEDRKGESRSFDLRPLILGLGVETRKDGATGAEGNPVIAMLLRIGSGGSARPSLVLTALVELGYLKRQDPAWPIKRTGLYAFRGGRLISPFDAGV